MKNSQSVSSLRPWWSRLLARFLRSRASHIDTPCHNEVLPHLYGTPEKDTSERTVESVHSEADAGSGRPAPPPRSGRLGCIGVDGEQLGSSAGIDSARRAAVGGVGDRCAASPDRAGDCRRPGLGQQEAVAVPLHALCLGTLLIVAAFLLQVITLRVVVAGGGTEVKNGRTIILSDNQGELSALLSLVAPLWSIADIDLHGDHSTTTLPHVHQLPVSQHASLSQEWAASPRSGDKDVLEIVQCVQRLLFQLSDWHFPFPIQSNTPDLCGGRQRPVILDFKRDRKDIPPIDRIGHPVQELVREKFDRQVGPRLIINRLLSQFIHPVSFAGVEPDPRESSCQYDERPYVYPIGFLCTWILVVIGGWHLKFPPRDGHKPKSWTEVYRRAALGIFFVVLGLGCVPLTYWLADPCSDIFSLPVSIQRRDVLPLSSPLPLLVLA